MNYRIETENPSRIRIRIQAATLTKEQAEILKFALSAAPGVRNVTVYRATAGCAIEYRGERSKIIRRLDAFRFENVKMMAKKQETAITASEMKNRKLDPALKRHLRLRILAETVADTVLPLPIQLAYHAYQMVTLREL